MNTFSSLDLNPDLLRNLDSLGYYSMTPIQAQSLPKILAGNDVIAQSKTGSGKTAAFGLGLLHKLDATSCTTQTLILCPTRELADQVAREIRRLARCLANIKVLTLCGGMPIGTQLTSLQHGANILVGTPGRIEDHIHRGSLHLADINTLVLDEADRMLEMGFQASVDAIIDQLPKWRQTLLFSATFPDKINSMAKRIMLKPVMVQVESSHEHSSIAQHFYREDDPKQYTTALRRLLLHYRPESSLIFCNTKRETVDIANALTQHGISALALNGDLEQWQRDQTMVRFANKSVAMLVATDVAARGLDIDGLDAVFNVHLPNEPETYIHRIGRTGRAGNPGLACSIFSDREHLNTIKLTDHTGMKITPEALPSPAPDNTKPMQASMRTIQIGGGKKQKLRPGDILGALTGKHGITGQQVGKIHILDNWAYVAVQRDVINIAQNKLTNGKLKGRSFRIRLL